MPPKYETKKFRESKIKAQAGLIEALDMEDLPDQTGLYLYSGQIAEYMDDRFLPLQPRAMLTVLLSSNCLESGGPGAWRLACVPQLSCRQP